MGNKFEKDLSVGSVPIQLMKFALPFLISNFVQSLYGAVDMIIVGQFSANAAASMSGVNIGGQITFVITNMVFGLCVGGTVLIAQYLGAGQKKELKETIGTLFTSLIVLSVIITIVFLILKKPLLMMLKTNADAFPEAESYFTVTMLGTIFIFAYNALSAVMRGVGDSKSPLLFVTIACVVNIILDLVFVGAFQWGHLALHLPL